MRKQDLIREVANEANLSEAQATKAVNAFLDAIHNSLANNTEVQISGFGLFKVVERAGREGRNPRTGETMTIAAPPQPNLQAGYAVEAIGRGPGRLNGQPISSRQSRANRPALCTSVVSNSNTGE